MPLSARKPATSAPARSPAPSASRMRIAPPSSRCCATSPTKAPSRSGARSSIMPACCPNVVLADITGRDTDGELIAVPAEWDESPRRGAENPAPRAAPRAARRGAGRRRPGAAAHREIERRRRRRPLPGPRHQGHRSRQAPRARHFPQARGRRRPAGPDRQEESRPRTRDSGRRHARRRGGRSRRRRGEPQRPARPADRAGQGAARLARDREGGEPDRHPRPRHSRTTSRREALRRGGGGAARRRSPAARTGATCPSSPSIRSTPRTTTTRCSRGPTPIRTIPAASSSTSRSPTSPITSRPAPRSTARRWRAAIRSISRTAWCRCCPSASPTTCARSSPASTGPAIAVRMTIGADGRKREHRFHRVLIRSLAKLHYAQVAGRHRRPAGRHHRAAAARSSSRRSMPPMRRSSAPATTAVRSISTCRSGRSCSSRTTPSTG